MNRKPRIFIGSSTEGIEVAEAIHYNLDHFAEVTPWFAGIFGLSVVAWESLERSLNKFDFAILVLSLDDRLKIRGKYKSVPRDNVLFELGLYVGKLGLEKCYGVVPRNAEDLRLPTDLAGITFATYESERSDGNLKAALVPACSDIKDAIKKKYQDAA